MSGVEAVAVVDAIHRHRESRANEAQEAYKKLIHEIAKGGAINDIDRVTAIMEAAGKTDANLKKDVALIGQRKEWAALFQQVPGLRAEIASHEKKITEANERLEAEKKKHKATVEALREQIGPLSNRLSNAEMAGDSLSQTGSDPAIAKAELAHTSEILALERERKQVEEQLSGHAGTPGNRLAVLKQELKRAEQTAKSFGKIPGVNSKQINLADAKAELAAFEKSAIKPLQDRLAAIAARRAEIDREAAKLNAEKMRA